MKGIFAMKNNSWKLTKAMLNFVYITVGFILIFVFSFFFLYSQINTLRNEMYISNISALSLTKENISHNLNLIDKYLYNSADKSYVRSFFDGEYGDHFEYISQIDKIQKELTGITTIDDSIESIYFYSNASRKIVTQRNNYSASSFSDMQWLDNAKSMKEHTVWLPLRKISDERNVTTLIHTYPIIAAVGDVKGYIVINFKNSMITPLPGQNSSFYVLDSENRILFSSADKNETSFSGLKFGDKEGVLTEKIGNKKTNIFYVSSAGGWKFVSFIPNSPAEKRISLVKLTIPLAALAIALIFAWLTIRFSRMVYKPANDFFSAVSDNIHLGDKEEAVNFAEMENALKGMIESHDRLEARFKQNLTDTKRQLIEDIVSKAYGSYEEAQPQLKLAGAELYPQNYFAIVLYAPQRCDKDKISKLCFAAESAITSAKCIWAAVSEDKGIIIVSLENADEYGSLSSAGAKAALKCADDLHIPLTASIGGMYRFLPQVYDSYMQANEQLIYKDLINGSIITPGDISINEDSAFLNEVLSLKSKLIAAFSENAQDECFALLDKIIYSKISLELILHIGLQITIECISISEFELPYGDTYKSIIESLSKCESLSDIDYFLKQILSELFEFSGSSENSAASSNLYEKIIDYINNHYAEADLSINLLAEKLGVSTSYISKIFKKNMKMNYIKYLTDVRLEHATQLLVNTDLKINEISEKVGYLNTSSFIRLFKKNYFVTPAEYRASHGKFDARQT